MSRDLYPGVGYGLILVQSVYTVGVHIVLMFCKCSVQHYSYCTGIAQVVLKVKESSVM